jgi:hypothetical protein
MQRSFTLVGFRKLLELKNNGSFCMFTENISDLKMTNLYGQNILSVTIKYK